MSEFDAEAPQTTASEWLLQGPYVAASARFEPITFQTKGVDSNNEPQRKKGMVRRRSRPSGHPLHVGDMPEQRHNRCPIKPYKTKRVPASGTPLPSKRKMHCFAPSAWIQTHVLNSLLPESISISTSRCYFQCPESDLSCGIISSYLPLPNVICHSLELSAIIWCNLLL